MHLETGGAKSQPRHIFQTVLALVIKKRPASTGFLGIAVRMLQWQHCSSTPSHSLLSSLSFSGTCKDSFIAVAYWFCHNLKKAD